MRDRVGGRTLGVFLKGLVKLAKGCDREKVEGRARGGRGVGGGGES